MKPEAHVPAKQKILIVDNDLYMRSLIEMALDLEGLSVMTACDGQEALEMLKSGEMPNLILTDLNMPGMNGSEFFLQLRNNQKTKDVPVILVSGLNDLEEKSKAIGAETFLRKPYSLAALTSMVKTHLH
jgi:CheY-like chemotaxis protein